MKWAVDKTRTMTSENIWLSRYMTMKYDYLIARIIYAFKHMHNFREIKHLGKVKHRWCKIRVTFSLVSCY